MAKYNSASGRANQRQRCHRCKTLVNMTMDRIHKGKRQVLCMACWRKVQEEEGVIQGHLFEDS